MSYFSHQGFLGGGGGGGGGSWYFVHGCGLCNEGGQGKTHQIIGAASKKVQGKKSKITIAPLYINYEPSLN